MSLEEMIITSHKLSQTVRETSIALLRIYGQLPDTTISAQKVFSK